MLHRNKALWLDVPSHVTSFYQSESFISEYRSYDHLKFVYHRAVVVVSLQRGYFRYHKFEVWIQSSTVNIWKDENKEKKRPGVGHFKTLFMTPSPIYAKHLFSCCYCLRSFSCKKVFWLVQFWMKEVESLKDEERLKKTSRRNAEWDRRRRRRLQMMISCVAFITYIGTMGHVSTKSQGTISNHIGRYCVTQ